VLADKLFVDFLCAGVVWKKCKGGDKELERGFKRSNVFIARYNIEMLSTIVL